MAKAKTLYTVVACQEDGNHLAEIEGCNWNEVSSFIATWTKQFEKGMDAGDGMRWDQNGHIQVHPQFNRG